MTFLKTTFAAATLAAIGTMSTASDFIVHLDEIDNFASVIELNTVSSTRDGYVQIVDERGMMLGMIDVHAGANTDLLIQLSGPATGDLSAQLVHSGSVVATERLDLDRF